MAGGALHKRRKTLVTSISPVASPVGRVAPPYPAALMIPGTASWRSTLANNGRIVLARQTVQIGRMEGNDVVLNDPLVSRYHAVIRWTPTGYEIEDLGSANGTSIQGQRIHGRALLIPGQTIQIGKTDLVFNVLDPQQQPNPLNAFPPPAGVQPGGMPYAPSAGNATLIAPAPYGALAYAAAGHPFYDMMARKRDNGFVRFFKTEWRKQYWRVFLLGLIAYFVVTQVLLATQNLHMVPLELLLASALVPVVFVIFCFEQNAFADMPLGVVGITFMSGAVLGLTIAAVLEPLLLPPTIAAANNISLSAALLIGVCEESAKVVSVLWFLRDRRLRSELDGLILGAAAGMGFAALETAGYGFVAFLSGFANALSNPNASTAFAIDQGVHQMNHSLILRMALAIFGHGVWTAIVCAAIWRDRRQSTFRLTFGVVLAFGIAVVLHALWDWTPLLQFLNNNTDPLVMLAVVLGWFLLVGSAGLFFLNFFLRESLRRAKLGPAAPPPPPLLQAIITDTFKPFFGKPTPQPAYAQPVMMAGYQQPQQSQQPLPGQPQPVVGQQRAPYCPRCNLMYPPGTQTCSQCHGSLV